MYNHLEKIFVMMKIFKTPSIWMPIVFALMDMAGAVVILGIHIYYPLLLILAFISLKHKSRTDGIFGFYLLACWYEYSIQ